MADEVAEREKREKLRREQNQADLKAVLELPQGRRFVSRLLFEYGALQEQDFTLDARQHAFFAGQRAVGVTLEREVQTVDRRLWALLHQERITTIASQLPDDVGNKTDH